MRGRCVNAKPGTLSLSLSLSFSFSFTVWFLRRYRGISSPRCIRCSAMSDEDNINSRPGHDSSNSFEGTIVGNRRVRRRSSRFLRPKSTFA